MNALRARFQPQHHHERDHSVSTGATPDPRVSSRDYFNYVPASPTVRAPSLPSVTPKTAGSPLPAASAGNSVESLPSLRAKVSAFRDSALSMTAAATAVLSPDMAIRHSPKFVRRTSAMRKQVAAGDLAMSNMSMNSENGGAYYRPSARTPGLPRMDTWRGNLPASGQDWQNDGIAVDDSPDELDVDDFELRNAVLLSIAKSIGLTHNESVYDNLGRSSIAPSVSALSTPNSPMFPPNTRTSRSPFGNVLDMMNASSNNDNMLGGMLREAVMNAQDRDEMSSVSASVHDSMLNGDANWSLLKDLEGNVEILFFKKGSTLVKEGEKSPGIYYVIDGFLDVSHRHS
jgi:lysophospholipid hydrolase